MSALSKYFGLKPKFRVGVNILISVFPTLLTMYIIDIFGFSFIRERIGQSDPANNYHIEFVFFGLATPVYFRFLYPVLLILVFFIAFESLSRKHLGNES